MALCNFLILKEGNLVPVSFCTSFKSVRSNKLICKEDNYSQSTRTISFTWLSICNMSKSIALTGPQFGFIDSKGLREGPRDEWGLY